MSETNPQFRIELRTALGGQLNYLTDVQEKAEAFFEKSKADDVYVQGIFGTVNDEGEIAETIDEFDRTDKVDA